MAALQAAGAAAVLIHGRTQEQRYSRAADWALISEVAAGADVPIIGNGDILTLYEARCLPAWLSDRCLHASSQRLGLTWSGCRCTLRPTGACISSAASRSWWAAAR